MLTNVLLMIMSSNTNMDQK